MTVLLLKSFELYRDGAPPPVRQGRRDNDVPQFDQQISAVGVSNLFPVLKLPHDNSGVNFVAIGKRADLQLRVQGMDPSDESIKLRLTDKKIDSENIGRLLSIALVLKRLGIHPNKLGVQGG